MNYSIRCIAGFLGLICLTASSNILFAQNPDTMNLASGILSHQSLILPKSVKTFVILIPNEGHESPLLPKDQRLINQPYVPQHLFASPNIDIAWFDGDVGHTRKITLTDKNSETLFNSSIKFNSVSRTISLNDTGTFSYHENKVNKDDPNFVMNGTITIINPKTQLKDSPNLPSTYETMSTLMIPTKDIKKYTELLDDSKVDVIGKQSFIDLRETGSGGGNQTLLVLGSNGEVEDTISVFKKITSLLPYG